MNPPLAAPGTRIGIFGGSFDPVHCAHVALAHQALDELRLDTVLWVPAGQPWQKDRTLTPAEDREAMVRLAIEGEPRFVLSRIEIERPGPSYTIDTVRELRRQQPEVRWFLILGQDQYAGFHTWHGWQELLASVMLAVAERPETRLAADPAVLAAPHVTVTLPPMEVSSTDIRERVARGLPLDRLVPPQVASYIARHPLYRDPHSSTSPRS